MGCAPAPLSAWPLAWLAIAPLWWLLRRASHWRTALGLGLAWGAGYHGLAIAWITGVHPMTWMGVPWLASVAIALFCWLAITGWGALLVATWALLFWRLQPATGAARLLLGVALWVGFEALWSAGPLWWSAIAYTQSPKNLWILHLGQLSGPTAVGAALVAVNGALAEAAAAVQRSRGVGRRWLLLALLLLLGTHALGAALYGQPKTAGEPLRVGLIQGNIPNDIKLSPEGWRRAIAGYTTGYETLAAQGVDAVLTPETALPVYWERQKQRSSLYAAIRERGVPAWVGA